MNWRFASLTGVVAWLLVNTIQVDARDAVQMTGVLLSKNGTPAVGYGVYVMHVVKGIVVWDCAEDMITIRNPAAKTDKDGKFTLSASMKFINRRAYTGGSAAEDDDGGAIGMTLILVPPGGEPMRDGLRPVDENGRRRVLHLDLGAGRIDVGKLNVGSTKKPAASGKRTPSMYPPE